MKFLTLKSLDGPTILTRKSYNYITTTCCKIDYPKSLRMWIFQFQRPASIFKPTWLNISDFDLRANSSSKLMMLLLADHSYKAKKFGDDAEASLPSFKM